MAQCDRCKKETNWREIHRHIPLDDLREKSISRYKKNRLRTEFGGFLCTACRAEGEQIFGKDFFMTEAEYDKRNDYLEKTRGMKFSW